ncbi:hypothetical protein [Micromonospora echinospora]|uniref:hypothetical protein n=1 Tax=Micromonospora echinospora TaxID=1877 RepID=UPI00366A8DC2
MALAVIDAIWSIGVRYGAVGKVVDAYRRVRRDEGGQPDRDDLPELLDHYERIGGPEQFAIQVRNRQRVSTHPGAIRKAEAVHRAASGLKQVGVSTCAQLRASVTATGLDASPAKKIWLAVPGQRSGISWRYLLMLVGIPNVKPDRWICRFVARSLEREDVVPDSAACLVERAAELLGVSPTVLDHEIWRYERGVRRTTPLR